MNRYEKLCCIRNKLLNNEISIGSWMQISNSSIAEILGHSGYDWVAIDLEHGAFSYAQLPDIFRSLELGNTLPLVRLSNSSPSECKSVLDSGAGGVIAPQIESASQLSSIRDACRWPPSGTRGVGFSRANMFGKNFDEYQAEAQSPLLIAMIESINAVNCMDEILRTKGLDAILVGPYDLSASLKSVGNFDVPNFTSAMDRIISLCNKYNIACGIHVVNPDQDMLELYIKKGYQFLAYSMDSVFINSACQNPLKA